MESSKNWVGLLMEFYQMIQEQDAFTSSVPPTTAPVAPETNAASMTPPSPMAVPPTPTGEQPKPFDVDTMIDRLNIMRGGKSFSDPEVYGQLTTYFNSLSDVDKATIDRFLQNINKIVIQVQPDQQNPAPTSQVQPPMVQQPMAAAPAMAPAAPIAEEIGLKEQDLLVESIRPGIKFTLSGRTFDLGSPHHVKILKSILAGLESVRDCHQMGSANRAAYSNATHRLKNHIKTFESTKY